MLYHTDRRRMTAAESRDQHKNCGKDFDPVMICSECGEPLRAREVHPHAGPGAPEPAAAG